MSSTPDLHILGCGRAARVIARLWHEAGRVRIGQVVNRSLESAQAAVKFIGAGRAAVALDDTLTGGWLLLGLPDGEIEPQALGLARHMPGKPELVFHLSGSVQARVLAPLGASWAAIHPARPFADPDRAVAEFSGTWCVGEGEPAALDHLLPAFEAVGGKAIRFSGQDKRLYHAATVAASNFLVALNELSRQLAEASGLPPQQAAELLGDLHQDTLDGLRGAIPADRLTGPIERGDHIACRNLVLAVARNTPELLPAFKAMARETLRIARRKHPDRNWKNLEELLEQ